jgi:ribokinase
MPGGRVLVIASFMQDTSIVVERFPRPGETITGQGAMVGPGGKGSNQAVQAALRGTGVIWIRGPSA